VEQALAELHLVARGERLRDRLRIARVLLYAHLRLGRGRRLFGWLPVGDDPPSEVRLSSGVSLVARRRDAVPLYEQFGLDSYGVTLHEPIGSILDLGANVGFAAVSLAARHPGAHLVCVEPDPESFALLERNLALNHIEAAVYRAAVVGEPGRYAVASGAAPASNRVFRSAAGEIDGITVGEALGRAGLERVDLMKIDIEGAEAGVFADARDWAPRVRAIIAELHAPYGVADADALLALHGFELVPLPDGARFCDVTLWVSRPLA
jgi:FkbM family methyltransferase